VTSRNSSLTGHWRGLGVIHFLRMLLPRSSRLLVLQACLLFAVLGAISLVRYGDDAESSELLSQSQVGSDDRLSELEKEREHALEKVRMDEGRYVPHQKQSRHPSDDQSPTSQLAASKNPRCGSLCRARREIVKVKRHLDSTANSVIKKLSCHVRSCSPQVHVVRRVPMHEFIQPIIQPLQPIVSQRIVQPIKRKSSISPCSSCLDHDVTAPTHTHTHPASRCI
jgi:hypothetical protein